MNKFVVLAGASGFLGGNLAKLLVTSSFTVIGITRRQISETALKKFIGTEQFIAVSSLQEVRQYLIRNNGSILGVINAATCYGRSEQSIAEIIDCNILYSVQLAEFALAHSASWYLNVDTFFSKPEFIACSPSAYTTSKRQNLVWLKKILSEKPIKSYNLRIEHMYGSGDAPHKFVPWLLGQLKHNMAIELGSGNHQRDFIFIDDVCDAVLKVIADTSERSTEMYEIEIGCGVKTTISAFANIAKNILGSKSELIYGLHKQTYDLIDSSNADTRRIKALGWTPQVSIAEGILLSAKCID